MGVRINKVLNELNIGLQTAIDFLKQRRELGEVRDDMTPNTKISDEQYEALVKKFGVDKSVKEKASKIFINTHGRANSDNKVTQENDNTKNNVPDLNPTKRINVGSHSKTSSSLVRNIKPLKDFNWDEFEASATTNNTDKTDRTDKSI